MHILADLLAKNRAWATAMRAQTPDFFERLSKQQAPRYLWIGCSDSRVPANQIVGLAPGEMFVHRNVANVVAPGDLNCLSVLQFAVDVLKVEHVIVCGHYGCGGVQAVHDGARLGLVNNWLRPVERIWQKHRPVLERIKNDLERIARLCELNVIEQVRSVAETTVLAEAWTRGQSVSVHGWIYAISDGLLKDLNICLMSPDDLPARYDSAVLACVGASAS